MPLSTPCPATLSTAQARPLRSECPDCQGHGRVDEKWCGHGCYEFVPGRGLACPTCCACSVCLTGDGSHPIDNEGTRVCSGCFKAICGETARDLAPGIHRMMSLALGPAREARGAA